MNKDILSMAGITLSPTDSSERMKLTERAQQRRTVGG